MEWDLESACYFYSLEGDLDPSGFCEVVKRDACIELNSEKEMRKRELKDRKATLEELKGATLGKP